MDSGLDTVSAFRRQLSFYEGRLVKSYVVDAGMEEQEARFIYERNKQRLQTNDWVRIAHISKYLPQNATPAAEQAAQAVMDSIYSALRSGLIFRCWHAVIQTMQTAGKSEACCLGCLSIRTCRNG